MIDGGDGVASAFDDDIDGLVADQFIHVLTHICRTALHSRVEAGSRVSFFGPADSF